MNEDANNAFSIFTSTTTQRLEESKLIAGIASLIIFVSAKYILSDIQGCFGSAFNSLKVKFIGLFCVVFINSRSLHVSLLVTSVYFILRDKLAESFQTSPSHDECQNRNFIW